MLRRAAQGEVELLMSEISLGEVYYILLRTQGQGAGEEIFTSFLLLPLERVATDFDLVLQAAKLKASIPVSYADCFAVAPPYFPLMSGGNLKQAPPARQRTPKTPKLRNELLSKRTLPFSCKR